MQYTLELVESQVSARSRWHFLGASLVKLFPATEQRLRGRTRDRLEAGS
jgi:hypothetical protein